MSKAADDAYSFKEFNLNRLCDFHNVLETVVCLKVRVTQQVITSSRTAGRKSLVFKTSSYTCRRVSSTVQSLWGHPEQEVHTSALRCPPSQTASAPTWQSLQRGRHGERRGAALRHRKQPPMQNGCSFKVDQTKSYGFKMQETRLEGGLDPEANWVLGAKFCSGGVSCGTELALHQWCHRKSNLGHAPSFLFLVFPGFSYLCHVPSFFPFFWYFLVSPLALSRWMPAHLTLPNSCSSSLLPLIGPLHVVFFTLSYDLTAGAVDEEEEEEERLSKQP